MSKKLIDITIGDIIAICNQHNNCRDCPLRDLPCAGCDYINLKTDKLQKRIKGELELL